MTHVPGRRLAVVLSTAGLLATGCTRATSVTGFSPGEAVTQGADGLVGIDPCAAVADAPGSRPDDAAVLDH